jgi:hypothetical protein
MKTIQGAPHPVDDAGEFVSTLTYGIGPGNSVIVMGLTIRPTVDQPTAPGLGSKHFRRISIPDDYVRNRHFIRDLLEG